MPNNDRHLRYFADGQTIFAVMIRSLALKAYGNYVMVELNNNGLVTEQATPTMGVTVTSGDVYVNGADSAWNVGGDLTVDSNATAYTRYDLIVADISATNEAIVKGTAAAAPQVPSPGETRDIPLAIVRVRAGASQITNEDIIDVRA